MIRKLAILTLGVALLLQGCKLPARNPADSIQPSPTVTFMPITPLPEGLPASTSTALDDVFQVTEEFFPTPEAGYPVPTERAQPTVPNLLPSATSDATLPQVTPSPTPQPTLYGVQPGTPVIIPGFPHPELGCKWMGIGGQVFDYGSNPVKPLVVQLKGTIGGTTVDQLSVTGTAKEWGEGGFEFKIADKPAESSGTLYVQFFDLAGIPVSGPVYLTTYADCSRNSILINMVQISGAGARLRIYFPFVRK